MTRRHYQTVSTLVLVSLALIAVLSACRAGPVGIFASIAQETDINASRTAAFDGTSPDFVGILGTNYYTIINGTIWSRAVAGGSWGKLATLPAGVSSGTASSATIAGSNLFVTFGLIGDSSQKVWITANGTTWDDTFTDFPSTVKVDSLLSANSQAFAVTRTDTTVDSVTTTEYSVHHWDGASFVTAGGDVTDITSRPTSMAYDGAEYWLTAGQVVYRNSAEDSLAVFGGTPSDTFSGVVNETGDDMILSSKTGKLHKFDGTDWSSSDAFEKSGTPHAFSAPAIVTAGGESYLLVGTVSGIDAATASGYLEFTITGGFNPATASENTGSDFAGAVNFQTSVSTNYISKMTVADETGGNFRVFALTVGNGLWSNFFNGTSWSGWARE